MRLSGRGGCRRTEKPARLRGSGTRAHHGAVAPTAEEPSGEVPAMIAVLPMALAAAALSLAVLLAEFSRFGAPFGLGPSRVLVCAAAALLGAAVPGVVWWVPPLVIGGTWALVWSAYRVRSVLNLSLGRSFRRPP